MCNILCLEKGVMPKKNDFINMCHNNWHSYGMVTKIDGRLNIERKVPANGEIDPQELWNLLVRDQEFERFVHVRHMTAGTNTIENCHPFEVFYTDKRQVVFMHNGTLYDYKAKKYVGNTWVDDDSGPSDTFQYVDTFLSPVLSTMNTGKGHGDFSSDIVRRVIRNSWPLSGNRGVIIANDQEPMFLGDWKSVKSDDGKLIKSANDEYFKDVIRGPEKERREEAKKKASSKLVVVSDNTQKDGEIAQLSTFRFGPRKYDLKSSLKFILGDYNLWDRDCATALGAATKEELEKLLEDRQAALHVMDWVFSDYHNLYQEHMEALRDKKTAENLVARYKGEVEEMTAERNVG